MDSSKSMVTQVALANLCGLQNKVNRQDCMREICGKGEDAQVGKDMSIRAVSIQRAHP